MAKKKRIPRKKLKEPDEFLTFSAKAIQLVLEQRLWALIGLSILVVLILGWLIIRHFSELAESQAYAILEKGRSYYTAARSRNDRLRSYEKSTKQFEEVLKKYPGTKAYRLALLAYANYSYDVEMYQKAIELYEEAVRTFSEDTAIKGLLLRDLAYCYEELKDYKRASEYLEKVTGLETEFLKGEAYFHLGLISEMQKNTEKAVEQYEKVVRDYPETLYVEIAKDRLIRLKTGAEG
nr:tetratricopeptide repeat protein [Desulfobacterales bacterium]